MMKRLFTISVFAAAIAVCAGCGCVKDNSADDTQKNFSVFIKDTAQLTYDKNKIFQKIEDELGYTYDIEYLAGSEKDKYGIMIASGTYPDLIACGDTTLIQAGALIPLDDYITEENTPNLYEYLKPIWKKACYSDGHIYIIPNYGRIYGDDNEAVYQGPAFWVQKAVLADAGYPEIRTLDEYFDLIENYKNKYPRIDGQETIGFGILTDTGFEYCMTTPPLYLAGNPNDGDVMVDRETYTAQIYADKDISHSYFKKLNEMYEKGVIDTEAFTQNKEQYLEKISSGRVLGMFDQHWIFQNAEFDLGEAGKYERQYVPLPITLDESIEPWYRDVPLPNINQGYGISVNCKDPKAAVMMIEMFMSEKWQKIFQWGIEGEDYMVSSAGRIYRTEEQSANSKDALWRLKNRADAFFGHMPKIQGQYSDGNGSCDSKQPEVFESGLNDYDRTFLKKYGRKNWYEFMNPVRENPPYYPAWNIELDNASEAYQAHQRMTETSVKYVPKLIMSGNDFENVWSEYCAELDLAELDAYVDRVNEEIQWRIENW